MYNNNDNNLAGLCLPQDILAEITSYLSPKAVSDLRSTCNNLANNPVLIDYLINHLQGLVVKSIAAGFHHTICLLENGQLMAWGRNTSGQLGLGDTKDRYTPTLVPGLTRVKSITAGVKSTMCLLENGQLLAWGDNMYGRLGLGHHIHYIETPTLISDIPEVEDIALGGNHAICLLNNKQLMTWGNNRNGQLGLELGDTKDRYTPTLVPNLQGVKDIFAGNWHTMCLLENGQVFAWGNNRSGQLGLGDANDRYTPTLITGLTGVKDIAAGHSHTICLFNDEQLMAWGGNRSGQLGLEHTSYGELPTPIHGLISVKSIAAGANCTTCLLKWGEVLAWGYSGEIEGLSQPPPGGGPLGRDAIYRETPTLISDLAGVEDIAAGVDHTLCILENGQVLAWGYNEDGQLGLGDTNDRNTPELIEYFANQPKIKQALTLLRNR